LPNSFHRFPSGSSAQIRAKALWQLAQLKHQVLQRRVAAVGQQRQNVRDLLVGREAPDEQAGGTFVILKRDTATYPEAMADAQAGR
jgi:hypothetical protein